jgi:hypothetical protein
VSVLDMPRVLWPPLCYVKLLLGEMCSRSFVCQYYYEANLHTVKDNDINVVICFIIYIH